VVGVQLDRAQVDVLVEGAKRVLSRMPTSRMPGSMSGWPTAPRNTESNFLNSSIALSGKISPVRL
jgi:hypothetical protein